MENDFDIKFLKIEDPVLDVISKCKNHQSVIKKKKKKQLSEKFSFFLAQFDDVLKKIKNFDIAKTPKQVQIFLLKF